MICELIQGFHTVFTAVVIPGNTVFRAIRLPAVLYRRRTASASTLRPIGGVSAWFMCICNAAPKRLAGVRPTTVAQIRGLQTKKMALASILVPR